MTEQFKPVEVNVLGKTHRVVCEQGEEATLQQGVDYINQQVKEIRRSSQRMPDNEELLVLVCLDLYDQLQSITNSTKIQQDAINQATALIQKIQSDAKL